MGKWQKVVVELADLIRENHWAGAFNKAIEHAQRSNIPEIADQIDFSGKVIGTGQS